MLTLIILAVLGASPAPSSTETFEKSAIQTLVKRIDASPSKFEHQNGGRSLAVDVGSDRYQIYSTKYTFTVRFYDKWTIQDDKLDGVVDFAMLKTTRKGNKSFNRELKKGMVFSSFWQDEYRQALRVLLDATETINPQGRPAKTKGIAYAKTDTVPSAGAVVIDNLLRAMNALPNGGRGNCTKLLDEDGRIVVKFMRGNHAYTLESWTQKFTLMAAKGLSNQFSYEYDRATHQLVKVTKWRNYENPEVVFNPARFETQSDTEEYDRMFQEEVKISLQVIRPRDRIKCGAVSNKSKLRRK